ncbi:MAG: VOC family protein [Pseudomonadota bacterium]
MATTAIDWFEIYVKDLAKSVAFYEAVLGVTLEPLGSQDIAMRAFPKGPSDAGAAGALVHVPGYEPSGNTTVVYFQCDDVATEAARVEGAGGKVHRPKMSIGPYGFVAHIIDPEGNMFGLHSMT